MTIGELVDSHCHLAAYADPVSIIDAAEAANTKIVAVTEDPDEYRRLKMRVRGRSSVDVALGLHPLRAAGLNTNHLARFFRFLPEATWIGEVGLDFSPAGIGSKKAQLNIFDTVLTQAQPGRHPMTVHSRGAAKEVISHLEDAAVPAVLHWYSGPMGLIDKALNAGLYFSLNAPMLHSRRSTELLNAIPPHRILLETDGPYAKTSGRPSQPDGLAALVRILGRVWGVTPDAATQILGTNYTTLTKTSTQQPD